MNKDQSSYRQIVKATSIYGGVQVIQILINIIKSKFIAILLGPSGMGIAGLLTSSIEFIQSLTSFGLKTSAVKDISEADASKNELRISIKIKVFRRLVWITGLIGACVTLIFRPSSVNSPLAIKITLMLLS
ncbi:MAG: oligosaccharide flippase family protein [Chitinophagales bacterium]|nr:oligosaccharide flippase family protein [Chitinophagales bacterium]